MDSVKLNNGVSMPMLGLGTFKSTDSSECIDSVTSALELGYRMIDTARMYKNEEFVGEAVASSGIDRHDIFLTTKVWCDEFDDARKAVDDSLTKLRTDYIDLVRYNEVVPAVNQIETNLTAQRLEEHEWMVRLGIQHEGYMPFSQGRMNEVFDEPSLVAIAEKHGKSVRQVALRYQVQCGVIVIPKSVHRERIQANADIFDFELSPEEMAAIRALDRRKPMTGIPEDPERVMKITGFQLL